ncbi:MAG: helix-turn-helix domain-containing protein [Clostridiales bacterium]|nr:helix-turn-helix domain-containing protein [Clostridiales bacterium]
MCQSDEGACIKNGVAISKIAKNYNITRQTIYQIKNKLMSKP